MPLRRYLVIGLAVWCWSPGRCWRALWFATARAASTGRVGEAARRSAGRLVFEGVRVCCRGQISRTHYLRRRAVQVVADDVDLTWSAARAVCRVDCRPRLLPRKFTSTSRHGGTTAPRRRSHCRCPSHRARRDRPDRALAGRTRGSCAARLRYRGDTAGHHLDELALRALGRARGDISVGANPPLVAAAIPLYGSDRCAARPGEIDIDGDLAPCSLRLGDGTGLAGVGTALVAPFEPVWLRELEVAADDIDLAPSTPGCRRQRLARSSPRDGRPVAFSKHNSKHNAAAGAWSTDACLCLGGDAACFCADP